MIRCTSCGSENKDNVLYCRGCGGRVNLPQDTTYASPIKCPSCFFVNPPRTFACKKCGIDLKSEVRRLQRKTIVTDTRLTGLGGWLILVIIGLVSSILTNGGLAIVFFNAKNGGYTLPEAAPLLNSLILISIIFFILPSIGLVLMIYTKKIFRSFMIGMYILAIVSSLVQIFILLNNGSDVTISFTLVKSIIWIVYFVKSKRVRNTFVN